jgi:hypothetical protein
MEKKLDEISEKITYWGVLFWLILMAMFVFK